MAIRAPSALELEESLSSAAPVAEVVAVVLLEGGAEVAVVMPQRGCRGGSTPSRAGLSAFGLGSLAAPDLQSGWMQHSRLGSMRREATEAMVCNIGREVRELRAALADCRGDRVAEPKVTAALLAHLLISGKELLQNLLINTARRPRSLVIGSEGPASTA
ncbi:MAG: hypothetical protein VKI42_10295 [Synechococcaceae cyanobacterium]|nr:hypothetical protein [Synechococcaceae cyanobacterium]